MAGLAGFEPTNDGIKNRCLTTWRQPNMWFLSMCAFYGALGEIRTHDPCLRRAILYPAELQVQPRIKSNSIYTRFFHKLQVFFCFFYNFFYRYLKNILYFFYYRLTCIVITQLYYLFFVFILKNFNKEYLSIFIRS